MKLQTILGAGIVLAGLTLCAGSDAELNLNGKFRGATSDAASVPGWIPDNAIGSYRILPTKDADEFQLEIASSASGKSLCSEFHPVIGNRLKVELKYSGSGSASVSCFFHDAQRRQIGQGECSPLIPVPMRQERKLYFAVPAGAVFVRIVLSAGENSTVRFEDVEAECKIDRQQIVVPPVPAAGRISVAGIPANAVPVVHEQRIYYRDIPNCAAYQAQVLLGSDFELKLGEDSSKQLYWQVVSYDPGQCLLKIDHDHNGIGSWNWDKAEIEIKPLVRGKMQLELQCGPKRATIYLTVL